MNRFAEIETFVAVFETGSLSAAAIRLNIAVSAVSRRIGELETRLGVRLANRSTRGFAPTAQGQDYYERCVRLLADLAAADASTGGEHALGSGLLRIAAPMSFGYQHLGPLLTRFAAMHENLRFDLDLSDRRSDLMEDGFDLAIRIGELEDSRLVARKLFDVRLAVVASPAFWQRHGHPLRPHELSRLPALLYRSYNRKSQWEYVGADDRSGRVPLTARFTATNGEVLALAAERGLGVACLPTFICADAIREARLEPVLSDYRWFNMAAWVVYPAGCPLPVYAREFTDFLVASFSHPLAWD